MMVALSIRQPWHAIGGQMEDWSRLGAKSRFLFGFKSATHAHLLRRGKATLYKRLQAAGDDAERMDVLLDVPGLGLPKAGFVVQLWNGGAGCIDVHNIRAYNTPTSMLRMPTNASRALRARKISEYLDLCEGIGSEHLWDAWCEGISQRSTRFFTDAHSVSEAHVDYLLRVA
jgi:hypothetical protein